MNARPNSLLVGRDDLAAELLVQRLLAVADAEQRQAAVEERLRRARAFRLDHRGRAAGEDDPLGCSRANASSAALNGAISE